MKMRHNFVGEITALFGGTRELRCEPRGIPQNGPQMACAVTIYFDDVMCKLA